MKAMQYALSPSGAIGGNPIVQGGAQAVQGLPDLMRKIQNAPPSLVHAVQQYLQGVPGNLPQAPGQEKLINMFTAGALDGMTPPSPSPQPQQ
jgi:hypothetical protein